MESLTCRLLPFVAAAGPLQMAADETLLTSAAAGVASLRFYAWTPATLSLGYFQPEQLRHAHPRLPELPFVRRPSGGATLVHHHEVTYALALPAGTPWQRGESWLCRMHQIIVAALAELGVRAGTCAATSSITLPNTVAGRDRFTRTATDVRESINPLTGGEDQILCFLQHTPGDVLIDQAKIVGSAQRRHQQALLQHGAILLRQSDYTPELPGIYELTGKLLSIEDVQQAVIRQCAKHTGWRVVDSDWTDAEQRITAELNAAKYATAAWNRKR
ncbi:MAG: biotin/lipoate A/B protein ligase family protein [Gemmataceae bacterium]